jgi:integrase/recombinase XerD
LKGDIITFVRQKTKFTTTTGVKEIKVYVHEELLKIINKWGTAQRMPENYIFPVIKNSSDFIAADKARAKMKKVCNHKLSEIGRQLGFEVHLCLNLARHSFATMLKISGTPVSFISDAMGHTNTVTTEHYLKSLPIENMKEISSQLMSFA